MKVTYYQRGETLDYTSEETVAPGSVVALEGRIGIAAGGIAAGCTGALQMTGVFAMTKANTEKIAMGADVYYDPATDMITTAASSEVAEGETSKTVNNVPAGYAAADADTAATSVLVKLLG